MKKFKLNLKKKLNRKGFTLAELLVVVAILGILVAISVPLFAGRMEAAKKSTDEANVRAAKAAAAAILLSDTSIKEAKTYYYDADKGTLETSNTNIKAYGQSTTEDASAGNSVPSGKILKVTITPSVASSGSATADNSSIVMEWEAAGSTSG